MAQDSGNRRLPLTKVYIDGALPATGSKVALTNGVPGGAWFEIGALEGPVDWDAESGNKPFESEGYNVPLDYDRDSRGLSMVVKMKEITGVNLQVATGGDLIIAPDGMSIIRIGSGNSLESRPWLAVWETRAGTGYFEHAIVYDGIVDGVTKVSLSRKDYTIIEVKLIAKPVLTRPTGDDLGYITTL